MIHKLHASEMTEKLGVVDRDDDFCFSLESALFCIIHIRNSVYILDEQPCPSDSIPMFVLDISIFGSAGVILVICSHRTIIVDRRSVV